MLTACVIDADLELPDAKSSLVLNGILHPDSIVSVSLSLSSPLSSASAYQPVTNGEVFLYVDQGAAIRLDHQGDGRYTTTVKPLSGHHYRVTAFVPGFEILNADDTVPLPPVYTTCYEKIDRPRADVGVNIKIEEMTDVVVWLDLISSDYNFVAGKLDTTNLVRTKFTYINSNSPVLDNFNSTFDQENGSNQFVYYLRVDPAFNDPFVTITGGATNQTSRLFRYSDISKPIKDESLIINVLATSSHYDKYLKSTILDFINTEFEGTPSPFSGPVKIYSNVKNGTGIFAALNYGQTRIERFPCQ
jgi:hypothetical protein